MCTSEHGIVMEFHHADLELSDSSVSLLAIHNIFATVEAPHLVIERASIADGNECFTHIQL